MPNHQFRHLVAANAASHGGLRHARWPVRRDRDRTGYGGSLRGDIGDRAVYDFTAVGDVVNTAARLQAQAGPGEIIASKRVASGLATPAGPPFELSLKGKQQPETAYRIASLV